MFTAKLRAICLLFVVALAPVERAQPAGVVFLGDSITYGWPLAVSFPERGYVNKGLNGNTTAQMLARFRADVITAQPAVVVILGGINDIGGNFGVWTDAEIEGNLASMSEIATANGIAVVLASLTPVSNYHGQTPPRTTQYPMTRIAAINAWVRSYAQAHKHQYVDYFSAMVDTSGFLRAEWSGDDLHPNAAGQAVMTPLVEVAIQRTFGEGR